MPPISSISPPPPFFFSGMTETSASVMSSRVATSDVARCIGRSQIQTWEVGCTPRTCLRWICVLLRFQCRRRRVFSEPKIWRRLGTLGLIAYMAVYITLTACLAWATTLCEHGQYDKMGRLSYLSFLGDKYEPRCFFWESGACALPSTCWESICG